MAKESTTLKRAYCLKCRVVDERYPIFMVNPDAEVCYCPNCMRAFKPKVVIDEYNYFIAERIYKADMLLFRDTKFLEAYNAFANIIEIDHESVRARFGRILALVFMSKLRKSNFINAMTLFKSEADEYFHKGRDLVRYRKFLNRLNNALDEYLPRFTKKLTTKDRFYSAECVDLYFLRIHEILQFKAEILKEANYLYSKAQDVKAMGIANEIEQTIRETKVLFDQVAIDVDGYRYRVAKIANNRKVLVAQLDEKVNPLTHYIKRKLDDDEEKGKLIGDKVYPDNTHIAALIKGAIPLMIITFFIASGAFVASFFIDEKYKLYSYIGGSVFVLTAIITFICYLVWKIKLGKRRHLID